MSFNKLIVNVTQFSPYQRQPSVADEEEDKNPWMFKADFSSMICREHKNFQD